MHPSDFIIFAAMKVALKQTYLLFLALSLILITAECNFFGHTFLHFTDSTQLECSDLPDHSDHSGSAYFEDEVLMSDSEIKSTTFPGCMELVPESDTHFTSRYIASIWQPPKFS